MEDLDQADENVGWFNDPEQLLDIAEAMIHIAMIILLHHRLEPEGK